MAESSLFWTSGSGHGGPYSEDDLRMLNDVLAVAASADVGVVSSLLNILNPTTAGDNNMTIDTGYAVVDGTLYYNSASKAINVPASGSLTGGRLSLRKDWDAATVTAIVEKNSDGNPAIPDLVQTGGPTGDWDIPIATFQINGNTISAVIDVREFTREAIVPISFDGGGATIATGVQYAAAIKVPFACHLIAWEIVADQSGSIVVDLWKDTYVNWPPTNADTITGGDEPTISGALKGQNLTPTDWTRSWDKGDIIIPNVDSVATVEEVTLFLRVAIL